MSDKDYVTVRRPSDAPFGVLPGDLVSEETRGYDLSLVRSLTAEGLNTPITVRPLPGGRFKVVNGIKRLAALRLLIRTDRLVYDALRGVARPAARVFSLVSCRVRTPAVVPARRPVRPPELDRRPEQGQGTSNPL